MDSEAGRDADPPGRDADPPGRGAPAAAVGYEEIEGELRELRVRQDGIRVRMRAAIDLFWLVVFAVALTVLVSVTVLAAVAFSEDETGVGMLFSALVVVALPLLAVATWRAFGPLWTLSQQLTALRQREAELYERLATPTAVAAPRRGWRRSRRGQAERFREAAVRKGFRKVRSQGAAVLWAFALAALFLLMFVVGIVMGTAHRG